MGVLMTEYEGKIIPNLMDAISNALATEVAQTAVALIENAASENIYAAYTPSQYKRRYSFTRDESYNTEVSGTELTISEHVTGTGRAGDNLGEIIEAGFPYEWEHSRIYFHQPFPREFFRTALEEGINNGAIRDAIERGLTRQGF